MRCVPAHSTDPSTVRAVGEVVDLLAAGLGGEPADLVVAFASPHHAEGLGALADECAARSLSRHALGCTGEAIVAGDREFEGTPALSVLALRLGPGGGLRPIRLTFDDGEFAGWPNDPGDPSAAGRSLILLADPFSFPADRWLRTRAEAQPGLSIVGGMSSGGMTPGVNRLVLDADVYAEGAVGVLLEGVALRPVVSQGCRPIGRPFVVTRADGNVIKELGRRPAMEAFRELYESLPAAERQLVQGGLHLGRVINEYQDSFGRGDFLVRNVLGADDEGGLAITDRVRVGQTVQFHVRDAASADEDLRLLLGGPTGAGAGAAGALVFTCNGRGSRLFPGPDHDAAAIREALGPIPAAGFFAMGEIGPVGGQNFLHGFTASVALLGRDPGPTP